MKEGGTSFTFVTDGLESAVEQARAAANGKDVAVAGGGRLLLEVIKAGPLDELALHIAPVLLGDGMRPFDPTVLDLAGNEAIELTPTRVITPRRHLMRAWMTVELATVPGQQAARDGTVRAPQTWRRETITHGQVGLVRDVTARSLVT